MMIKVRNLGLKSYTNVWHDMQEFTKNRTSETTDEIWLLEHEPVYTLGQAGKVEHILQTNNIPIVNSDRGGQVTYHGPGQIIAYTMLDLRRLGLNISQLVRLLENTIIKVLNYFQILSTTQSGAPGVYVDDQKIASIGLRVKNNCTYHGLALNVDLDLKPFLSINPCGYKGLKMTQIKNFIPDITCTKVLDILKSCLLKELNVSECL